MDLETDMTEKKKRRLDIWVYIELSEDGSPEKGSLELLTPGKELAGMESGICTAVILGKDTAAAVRTVEAFGADRIIVVNDGGFDIYDTEVYTSAMCGLILKYRPDAALFSATQDGRDLAPRIAGRLKTGLTADCTGISYDKELERIIWTRPAFGGNLMAEIYCRGSGLQMGTVRQGVFEMPEKTDCKRAEIIYEEAEDPVCRSARVLESIKEYSDDGRDLEDSEIIVAGGRGTGGEKGFRLLEELAETLGAGVGASRAAVEAGYYPRTRQIGQTGRTVAPKLYIACGISGAVQHIAGMSRAETVVAINSDPEAPIHKSADYSIVGDMFEVIPELINLVKGKFKND